MNNTISTDTQLDFVLNFLRPKLDTNSSIGFNNIWNYVSATPEMGINNMMLENILDILELDNMIKKIKPPNQQPIYHITHKARTFKGYNHSNIWYRKSWVKVGAIIAIISGGLSGIWYIIELFRIFFKSTCK